MSKWSLSKALRRRKRQVRKDNNYKNVAWVRNVRNAVFSHNINVGTVRQPNGLLVDKDKRHPKPLHDPKMSNKKRLLNRKLGI